MKQKSVKTLQLVLFSALFLLMYSSPIEAAVFSVSSLQEFDTAHDNAAANDSILWEPGTYSDVLLDISKDQLFISAKVLGGTIFNGSSRVEIKGDNITFQGFQFLDGDIGTIDVINIRGSHLLFTQVNIRAYTSYKYLRIREESQYVSVTYCNFENRLNLDDQNILSILVDETNPGYHKIQYCSFKNFDGTGNDLGIEPIRIGLSTQADRISRSLVEYCYFAQCDGDGELISSKASQNVYRYNTFENNPKSELVLRHGSEAIVYGNFFLNGKGGVRVREGQNHYIYNNYFYELDDRAIYLQNNSSDPLDNINIAFNTIVDCSEVILGGNGSDKPTNVTLSNNIFADPDDKLFEDPTGTEAWIGNISFGNLGMAVPSTGMTIGDPMMVMNSEGYFGLAAESPAINAALPDYSELPSFDGIEDIDTEILFDMMGQERPLIIEEKDLGSNEYPHEILIHPIATEENTGPTYNTSVSSGTGSIESPLQDFMQVAPNPVLDVLLIKLSSNVKADVVMKIFDIGGHQIGGSMYEKNLTEQKSITKKVGNLPSGIYTIQAISRDQQGEAEKHQVIKFVKL